jgi:ELWxxDGT repeat protein
MEFEFGTNWATYSKYVGDIFGSALAAEGIFAFALEAGFLGILLFGWKRVSSKVHFFSTLKDVVPGTSMSGINLFDAINLSTKFIFPVSDFTTTSDLWESDGTPAGTKVFKSFAVNPGAFLQILLPFTFNFTTGTLTYPLFQGNKFFFSASTAAAGSELWVSDGTLGGTFMVKDINPGTGDGFTSTGLYVYTTSALFFPGNNGTSGNELWKSDGTTSPTGTSMVADINPGANDANPQLPFFLCNGKVIFSADNGDDPVLTDLYVVNGTFTPLPIQLNDFTVSKVGNDALLQWNTLQEINTKEFNIQRSFDALHFQDIGTIAAAGTSSNKHAYSFTDPGIINSGKGEVYYRIMASDRDGKQQSSKVLLLKLKAGTSWGVRMLENPVKQYVNVVLSGITGNVKLSIKDITGKAIFTNTFQNINGQITLPANLHYGSYILVAENNNERKVIKFIK